MGLKILLRVDQDNEAEQQAAIRQLGQEMVTDNRTDITEGDLVVGRYSVLPFYPELEAEITQRGATLINTYAQYEWVASMAWLSTLDGLTPATYMNADWSMVPDAPLGWVVKGKTNSRKQKWSTHMRAPDRASLKETMSLLNNDPLIAQQGLVVREYMPLRTYEIGGRGMPITNEWRCFFIGEALIAAGYYWAQAERAASMGALPDAARALATEAARKISPHVPFFVVDVGEVVSEPGSDDHCHWTVIEINSGQLSGLAMIDPDQFYGQLRDILKTHAFTTSYRH